MVWRINEEGRYGADVGRVLCCSGVSNLDGEDGVFGIFFVVFFIIRFKFILFNLVYGL